MGKRKVPERKQPTFWCKDGIYIVPYGHKSFTSLREEYSDIRVIFVKHCTPMSICKELSNPRKFENEESNYHVIDEEEMTLEKCQSIKEFKIIIRGKLIFWDGTNFIHRQTIICEQCFMIGVLTPKKGCVLHITKCRHGRTLQSSICEYCFARSFASFWKDIVYSICTLDNPLFIFKQGCAKYLFQCITCGHFFKSTMQNVCKNNKWCPFCSGNKLCGKETCKICFEKSFASFDILKRDCIQTSENLLLIFKQSHHKYFFVCYTCKHLFESSLSNIYKNQWCPYCFGDKLCGKEDCEMCYQKSFASFEAKKRDCIKTSQNLFLQLKHSGKEYDFVCFDCHHTFTVSLHRICQGTWCNYCCYPPRKLCGTEKNCTLCFEKSFASFHAKKRDCIQTSRNLSLIFKYSSENFPFRCYKCTHIFHAKLCNISNNKWCPYCIGRVCGEESCLICEKKCEMAFCIKKARKQTRITKIWYCDEHFSDCIARNPNETPLIYRAKISLEIYTLAELQRLARKDMDNDNSYYWSNPTSWDCRMIPGLVYKPDNLFCFDKNMDLLPFANNEILNLNNLGYVMMIEILEEGKQKHSEARSISDVDREDDIRTLFTIYKVPIGVLYVSMAHNKHFTAHPDDVFFHKIVSGEYEIIPNRIEAFQTRIKEVLDTLTFMFENKLNETKWIGH